MTAFAHIPILNSMVNYSNATLDRTFAALADPTRRALLARLNEKNNLSISELARPFDMSLPAVMKHLDVLSDAGLIKRNKTGRTVSCQLAAAPMESAMDWLHRYERFWSERLNRLSKFLEEDESWPPHQPSNQVSPSSAGSTRAQRKSSPPGPTRKK
ncbi:MAG: metalloregulator ArsR/SmtB family transcription factor [Hyphomicrobiales bacterium]